MSLQVRDALHAEVLSKDCQHPTSQEPSFTSSVGYLAEGWFDAFSALLCPTHFPRLATRVPSAV